MDGISCVRDANSSRKEKYNSFPYINHGTQIFPRKNARVESSWPFMNREPH